MSSAVDVEPLSAEFTETMFIHQHHVTVVVCIISWQTGNTVDIMEVQSSRRVEEAPQSSQQHSVRKTEKNLL